MSTSRYALVRKQAQIVLAHGFKIYAYSYRSLLDPVLRCLTPQDDFIAEHQFQGALYVLRGEHKPLFLTKHRWKGMTQVWPAFVLKLIDKIVLSLRTNIEAAKLTHTSPITSCRSATSSCRVTVSPKPLNTLLRYVYYILSMLFCRSVRWRSWAAGCILHSYHVYDL